MKKLKLLDVEKLSATEMRSYNGGIHPLIPITAFLVAMFSFCGWIESTSRKNTSVHPK